LIDILVLLVLANLKQSKKDEARVALERAIGLAEPGGWIRPFVEVGPELASLLGQLRSQGIAPDYVDQILAACGTNDRCARPVPGSSLTAAVVRPQSPRSKAERDSSPLIEPLTDRELEVLSLFEQRLTNKEIAQRLTISPGTVKRHAENIYRKLDVQRRAEAVSRARELGITHDR
jgi:LuxR family maltose regulon positive regulatory protein